jgi:hypothetical protein
VKSVLEFRKLVVDAAVVAFVFIPKEERLYTPVPLMSLEVGTPAVPSRRCPLKTLPFAADVAKYSECDASEPTPLDREGAAVPNGIDEDVT